MTLPKPMCALGLIVLCAAGCSQYESRLPETGAVLEGTVSLGSEPVPLAMVIVVGEKGSAIGQVEGGQYKVENVPLGEVKVGVNTEAVKGQLISQQMAQGYKGPGKGGSRPPPPKLVEVPSKYWEAEKSDIKTTVKRGNNTYNIELTK
jgi:hypothetical protein